MPIDFNCSSCSHLIRVPDGTEGKKTICPKCSVSQQIPGESEPAEPETPGMGEHDFSDQSNTGSSAGGGDFASDPANSYVSPKPTQHTTTVNRDEITLCQADVGAVISQAFELLKEKLGVLIGAVIVAFLLYGIVCIIQMVVFFNVIQFGLSVLVMATIPMSFCTVATQVFISVGLAKIALKIGRKEHVEFSELFNAGAQFLPIFGFFFLLWIIMTAVGVGIGYISAVFDGSFPVIIVVPFLYLAYFLFLIFCWPFFFLVVDGKAKLFDSFSIAAQITRFNIGTTILLGLISFGPIILGNIACGIGVLLGIGLLPLIITLWAVAYLQMTGQIQAR